MDDKVTLALSRAAAQELALALEAAQVGVSVPTTPAPTSSPSPSPSPSPTPVPVPVPAPAGGRVVQINLDWGMPGTGNRRVLTKDYGGFHDKDVLVVRFTTPTVSSAGVGAIQAAEFASVAGSRTACLSEHPGVFDNALGVQQAGFAGIAGRALVSGNTVTVPFVVGSQSTWYPVLKPNTTYYFNVRNTNGVGGDMVVELQKPPGL